MKTLWLTFKGFMAFVASQKNSLAVLVLGLLMFAMIWLTFYSISDFMAARMDRVDRYKGLDAITTIEEGNE